MEQMIGRMSKWGASLLVGGAVLLAAALPGSVQAQDASPCVADVIVRSGDTLSSIADRTLGDLGAYPAIVAATNAQAAADSSYATILDEGSIQVGWKLSSPAPVAAHRRQRQELLRPLAWRRPPLPRRRRSTPGKATRRTMRLFAEEFPVVDGSQLTIAYLRSLTYPGSDIVVEQVLAPGSNYERYLVSYQSEGLKNYAYMTIPSGQKPATGWPAIVFNHGYIPPEVYRSTERYVAYVDGFARNGYVVFRPDYRGHASSEGTARGAYGFPDYTIDVSMRLRQ